MTMIFAKAVTTNTTERARHLGIFVRRSFELLVFPADFVSKLNPVTDTEENKYLKSKKLTYWHQSQDESVLYSNHQCAAGIQLCSLHLIFVILGLSAKYNNI